jgi:hypothetical protein
MFNKMVIDDNLFPYAFYMGEAPRWVIANESSAQTPLITTTVHTANHRNTPQLRNSQGSHGHG